MSAQADRLRIGVIGAGHMGGALGTLGARAGHDVVFSYARNAGRLAALAVWAGSSARAGTPAAAARGDVVLLAVPWTQVDDALASASAADGALEGRVLVTYVSALRPDFTGEATRLVGSGAVSAAESIAEWAPGARVVEAFNATSAEILTAPDRDFGGERTTMLYCGDDVAAKAIVTGLIADCGFEPLDIGPLRVARLLEALSSVWVRTAVVIALHPGSALRVLRRWAA